MQKTTKRNRQTVRFLKWIDRYPGWWHLICTPDDEHMNVGMMKMLIERLQREKFYEIIFVLLMVHRNESFMKNIDEQILIKIVTDNWNGKVKNGEQIIDEILTCLN